MYFYALINNRDSLSLGVMRLNVYILALQTCSAIHQDHDWYRSLFWINPMMMPAETSRLENAKDSPTSASRNFSFNPKCFTPYSDSVIISLTIHNHRMMPSVSSLWSLVRILEVKLQSDFLFYFQICVNIGLVSSISPKKTNLPFLAPI